MGLRFNKGDLLIKQVQIMIISIIRYSKMLAIITPIILLRTLVLAIFLRLQRPFTCKPAQIKPILLKCLQFWKRTVTNLLFHVMVHETVVSFPTVGHTVAVIIRPIPALRVTTRKTVMLMKQHGKTRWVVVTTIIASKSDDVRLYLLCYLLIAHELK